jgi:prevent-host-death family protein
MLIDTDNLVTLEQFRDNLAEYVGAARAGGSALAVTQNSEVVGVFLSNAEYEALCGTAVKELLTARADGPTVAHDEVRKHMRKIVKQASAKP